MHTWKACSYFVINPDPQDLHFSQVGGCGRVQLKGQKPFCRQTLVCQPVLERFHIQAGKAHGETEDSIHLAVGAGMPDRK